jgi:hypothetical protein
LALDPPLRCGLRLFPLDPLCIEVFFGKLERDLPLDCLKALAESEQNAKQATVAKASAEPRSKDWKEVSRAMSAFQNSFDCKSRTKRGLSILT